MKQQTDKTKYLVKAALLSAVGFLLMMVEFPLPFLAALSAVQHCRPALHAGSLYRGR